MLHNQPDYPTEHQILDRLEELGMLPPRAKTYDNPDFPYEWEPEGPTPEELIAMGVCPCGADTEESIECCSQSGCPMYKGENE